MNLRRLFDFRQSKPLVTSLQCHISFIGQSLHLGALPDTTLRIHSLEDPGGSALAYPVRSWSSVTIPY